MKKLSQDVMKSLDSLSRHVSLFSNLLSLFSQIHKALLLEIKRNRILPSLHLNRFTVDLSRSLDLNIGLR